MGISQTAIGKVTGRSRSYVRNAQVAATVDEALSVASDGYALTLDQLAELAGFTDDEDATSRLLASAYEPGEWAHTLTYERQQREAAAAIATAREEFTGRGVTVPDEQGDYESRVDSLLHDGQPITDHSGCPGHAGCTSVSVTVTVSTPPATAPTPTPTATPTGSARPAAGIGRRKRRSRPRPVRPNGGS